FEVLCTGGDVCPTRLVERWSATRRVINQYGPTEYTSTATLSGPLSADDTPSIGRAISNTRMHVLDVYLAPVPIGVVGELYVAGQLMARGYLHQPRLTAGRFVANPFEGGGARMYRTGDRVAWRADGTLRFVGRSDAQVKVRGYRVEVGEVEAVLREAPGVADAVVVAEGSEAQRGLTAYWQGTEGSEASPAQLRERLRARLPEYMVPSRWVRVAALPLTATGKVDRRRVATAPEVAAGAAAVSGRQTPFEELVGGVWATALGAAPVDASAHFFEVGGHSLTATQVVAHVRRLFGIELALRELFDHPTLAEFAAVVERACIAGGERAAQAAPTPVERQALMPLSYAQQRLWFLEQLEPGQATYHVPLVVRLDGPLMASALAAAWQQVVGRHEALRTHVGVQAGVAGQVIEAASRGRLAQVDLRPLGAAAAGVARGVLETAAQARFELERGPLVRAALVRVAETRHVLGLTLHHLVGDGWSWGVLLRELGALYAAQRAGRAAALAPLAVQYADYAAWQRAWLTGAELERQVGYWRTQLAGVAALDLP